MNPEPSTVLSGRPGDEGGAGDGAELVSVVNVGAASSLKEATKKEKVHRKDNGVNGRDDIESNKSKPHKATPNRKGRKKPEKDMEQEAILDDDDVFAFHEYRVFHAHEGGAVYPSLRKKFTQRKKEALNDEWAQLRISVGGMYDIMENQAQKSQPVSLVSTMPAAELANKGGFDGPDYNVAPPSVKNMIVLNSTSKMDLEISHLKFECGMSASKVCLEEQVLNRQKNINLCAVCGEKANSKCQGCMAAGYCSKSHQKQDWKEHRPFCNLYEVVKDPNLPDRLMLVAKTAIKPGEVILIEKPYFMSPYSDDEYLGTLRFETVSKENQNMPVGKYSVEEYRQYICPNFAVCLGCNIYLCDGDVVPCKDCGWPTCATTCKQLDRHRELECQYFKTKQIDYEASKKLAILPPRIYGVLRGLLLHKEDPTVLPSMFNDASKKIYCDKSWNCMDRCATEYFLVTLRNVFKLEDLTYEEVNIILGLIYTKGVYGSYHLRDVEEGRMFGIYRTASYLKHANIGNVYVVQTFPPTLQVIATRAIKKGDVLYTSIARQIQLFETCYQHSLTDYLQGFPCDCQSCVKLSNEEKLLTAIRCLKCKRRSHESYLMVEDPVNTTTCWKCKKCGCTKTATQVRQMVTDALQEIDVISSSNFCNPVLADFYIRNALDKYRSKVFHPWHFLVKYVELQLIARLMINGRIDSLDATEVEGVIELLSDRISFLANFLPQMHSSIVALKVRLAVALGFQAEKIIIRYDDILTYFRRLENIYVEISGHFNDNTRRNVIQGYFLACCRNVRRIMNEVGEHYHGLRYAAYHAKSQQQRKQALASKDSRNQNGFYEQEKYGDMDYDRALRIQRLQLFNEIEKEYEKEKDD